MANHQMNRRNYYRELERIVEKSAGCRPKVLLHACCGPCSSSVLETLVKNFDVTVFWFNPNIYPESEFDKREDTLIEIISKMGLSDKVKIVFNLWQNEKYEQQVDGLENEAEGGKRCTKCFALRLKETAKYARDNGYDYFCTTLTVSRHKDAVLINTIGEEISKEIGVLWLPNDFKKHDGENRSAYLADYYGIYRQLYCGCRYSLQARINHSESNEQS